MLKTIFLAISVILIAVNLVMLWQIFHKMKYNPDKERKTLDPFVVKRLTVFAVNMVILSLIGIVQSLLQAY